MPAGRPVPRVLLLSWRDMHHPEAGGAEKYLQEISYGLAALGHEVTVRTAMYPGAVRDELVDGVRFIRRGGKFSVFPRAMLALALGRHRSEVVVDVQNGVPFLSPLVTSRPVVNLVHHVHREQWPVVFSPAVARFGWWLEAWVAPRVYRRSHYVAVSRSTRSELASLGVSASGVSLVYNGTDALPDPHVSKSAHPTIVVLGRLVPQKRVEIALEAAAALLPAHPDLEVLVVGSGYWESHLVEETRRLGLERVVRFTGHVSEQEKHRLLASSWVLAVPSLKEGWGLVVVEAGTHATPTVAFLGAGGLDESVRHGKTGLLIEGGVEEFTVAIGSLLDDTRLRQELSDTAGIWARQFRWAETVTRFAQVLRLAGGRASAIEDQWPEELESVELLLER